MISTDTYQFCCKYYDLACSSGETCCGSTCCSSGYACSSSLTCVATGGTTSTPSDNDDDDDKKGLSRSDIIAIGVGVGIGLPTLVLAIWAAVYLCCKDCYKCFCSD